MKGRILDYSEASGSGIISGDDNNRYSFAASEWKGEQAPVKGQAVDFDVDDHGAAIAVYVAIGLSDTLGSFDPKALVAGVESKGRLNYNIFDWYVLGLKNFANFNGRAQRQEFWYYVLIYVIIASVLTMLGGVLGTLFAIASIVPNVAISARRLHDTGRSGWWQLIGFIPVIGFIILIIWFALPGKQGANAYGADPLQL